MTTRILLTILQRTLSAKKREPITEITVGRKKETQNQINTCTTFGLWLLPGTAAKLGLHGIRRTGESHGKPELRILSLVNNAARNSQRSGWEITDSVLPLVSKRGAGNQESMMSKEYAKTATKLFAQTNSTRVPLVPEAVLQLSDGPVGDVYNLVVEDAHEYIAGGILVKNCRYGMYSYIGPGDKPREVSLQEAVTSTDPTGAMMQYRQAEAKLEAEEAPIYLRPQRRGRGD